MRIKNGWPIMQSQPLLSFLWVSCAYFCKTFNVCSVHIIYTIFYPTLFSVYKSLFNIHLSHIWRFSCLPFLSLTYNVCLIDVNCFNIWVSWLLSIPFEVNSFQPLFTSSLCYWLLSRPVSLLASCLFSKLSSTLKAGAQALLFDIFQITELVYAFISETMQE